MSIRGLDAWLTRADPILEDGPCGAYSPDGKYQCDHKLDHEGQHAAYEPKAVWRIDNCGGNLCNECVDWNVIDEMGYAKSNGPRLHDYTGEGWEYVEVASWPQREDDFTEDCEPTKRGSAVEVHCGTCMQSHQPGVYYNHNYNPAKVPA